MYETAIFGEIMRSLANLAKDFQITFWRTRDGEEIDFLVETDGKIFPIEAKLGSIEPNRLPKLEKISEHHWQTGSAITLTKLDQTATAIAPNWRTRSPSELQSIALWQD